MLQLRNTPRRPRENLLMAGTDQQQIRQHRNTKGGDVSQVLMYYTPNRLSTQCSPTRSSVIMLLQVLHCPHCQGTDIVRHGQTRQGKQRYRCREQPCASRTFLLDYSYPGQSPAVKQQIVDMAMNASGI